MIKTKRDLKEYLLSDAILYPKRSKGFLKVSGSAFIPCIIQKKQ